MEQPSQQPSQRVAALLSFSKKKLVILGIVVLLAIAIIFGVVSLRRGKQAEPPVGKIPEPTALVTITKDGFVPSTLSIKKGQTVKWVNNDDSPHRVASNPHPTHTGLAGFDSKSNVGKGANYIFNFPNTGTFGYHDYLNPGTIKGIIIVQ